MTNEIQVTSVNKSAIEGTWFIGTIGGTQFEVLVHDQADEDYNYNGGKVATLAIGKMGSDEYTAFSRGFYDGAKPTGELKAKFDAVASRYNG